MTLQIAPSSSKFNLKRHRKDINFRKPLLFLGFWAKKTKSTTQKTKNTRKSYRKLIYFRCLFRVFWIEFWRWGGVLVMVDKVFIQKRSYTYTWSRLIKTKYLWDLPKKVCDNSMMIEKASNYSTLMLIYDFRSHFWL